MRETSACPNLSPPVPAPSTLVLPLLQSPEFARTCELLRVPVRVCKRERSGRITALWQVQSRHFGPLGRIDLVSRGPVAEDREDLADWPDRFRRWHDGRPMILNADGLSPDALRAGGFMRVFKPKTLAMLPLSDRATMRAAMAQKWRNRLARAENAGLRVTRHALPSNHWLLEAEQTQMRVKRYRGLPPAFCRAFASANPGKAVLFEARNKGRPIAAALILRHGPMATWQIGHSNEEGRRLNAMNRLLWEAMGWLADQGHTVLDLGTINQQDAPGLAHFKLGTGAQAHRLGGTWLHQGALAPLARRLPRALAA